MIGKKLLPRFAVTTSLAARIRRLDTVALNYYKEVGGDQEQVPGFEEAFPRPDATSSGGSTPSSAPSSSSEAKRRRVA